MLPDTGQLVQPSTESAGREIASIVTTVPRSTNVNTLCE